MFGIPEDRYNSILEMVSVLPSSPGVYQYYDDKGKIIYVGKAKNLKKRVSSYFNREPENGKTRVLIKRIFDIKHIVVETEEDALLLENNLIKKYQPRYNVLLKDDKSYPWIVIKNEPYPRVFQTRTIIKDGSEYFGPYTSVRMVRTLLDLFKQMYPLRTCNYDLSEKNIKAGKYKRCLEFHLGNCKAPCEGLQSLEDYQKQIDHIRDILKGNINGLLMHLKDYMISLADEYKFEEAQEVKKRIEILSGYQSKSTIVNPNIHDIDVFSIISDDNSAYINFLKIINGAIIQAHTIEYKKKLDESEDELLSLAIVEIRERFQSYSKEIIVPFVPEIKLNNIQYIVPKIGDKKSLLELSQRNVKYYQLEKLKQQANFLKKPKSSFVLELAQKELKLSKLPMHIECFDNSNIQGTHPVSACVVFKNGKPSKKDYRHFNIKTVSGPNDFASMEEVVHRRYLRMLEEGSSLPQLIVIDGGKGQLSVAVEVLKRLGIDDKVAVISIAERLEEIYFPGDSVPLYLDKNSSTLKLIQNLRNEAHRFGLTFHQDKRSKAALSSQLTNIPGIGEKTIEILINHFKSVDNIKKASFKDLKDVVGEKRAENIILFFKK